MTNITKLKIFIYFRPLYRTIMSHEPIRVLKDTKVETPESYYKATRVEMYPHYLHIFTSREQNYTDSEIWIPADSNIEIGGEYNNPY